MHGHTRGACSQLIWRKQRRSCLLSVGHRLRAVVVNHAVNHRAELIEFDLARAIGVDFGQLGDVLVDGDNVAYIVCAPSTQKTIERLLPKTIGRADIRATEPGYKPEGTIVDMVVSRVDKRQNK